MMTTPVVLVGNAGGDIASGSDRNGKTWVRFGLAHSDRVKNGDRWEDGPTAWYQVAAFGALADNVLMTLQKGTPVIVAGTLTPKEYQTREGGKGLSLNVVADAIGVRIPEWTTQESQPASYGQQRPTQRRQEPEDDWSRPTNVQQAETIIPPGATRQEPWLEPTYQDDTPF
jgi:single-strand DNA-binding protein